MHFLGVRWRLFGESKNVQCVEAPGRAVCVNPMKNVTRCPVTVNWQVINPGSASSLAVCTQLAVSLGHLVLYC